MFVTCYARVTVFLTLNQEAHLNLKSHVLVSISSPILMLVTNHLLNTRALIVTVVLTVNVILKVTTWFLNVKGVVQCPAMGKKHHVHVNKTQIAFLMKGPKILAVRHATSV